MYQELRRTIEQYEKIVILRHVNPDGDAVFSQYALETFLKDNYPLKQIRRGGKESWDLFGELEEIPDSFFEGALAVILDTSNVERIDDQRYVLADQIIKIDHHPNHDPFGKMNIVKDSSPAVCALLTEILFSDAFCDLYLSEKACRYLYSGIVADTLNFRTSNCTAETLDLAARLVQEGDFHMSDVADEIFVKSKEEFRQVTELRSLVKFEDRFAYLLLEAEDLKKIGISCSDAKNNVGEFGNIIDVTVWAIIAWNEEKQCYEASLRSRRGYPVNGIARDLGGGGHANAAGIKDLTPKEVQLLIARCRELSLSEM